jgi:hypothetical protein
MVQLDGTVPLKPTGVPTGLGDWLAGCAAAAAPPQASSRSARWL